MENNAEHSVEIKSDEGVNSIGLSQYFRHSRIDTRYMKLLSYIVISAVVLVYTFVVLRQKKVIGRDSKELTTPSEFSKEVPLTAPQILHSTADLNLQNGKHKTNPAQNKINIVNLRSLVEIPIGTEGKAIMVSGGTDGIVKAKLIMPILINGEPLIPENSILFGLGKSGEDRLYIEFQKVIFPTGEAFKLVAQSFDLEDKIQGLKGAVVGQRTKKMGMAMGLGFLGGLTDGLRENTSGSLFMSQKPNVKDAALSGASKAALDQSAAYLEEMKKSPNIIQVKAGTEFYIIVDEEKRKDNNL